MPDLPFHQTLDLVVHGREEGVKWSSPYIFCLCKLYFHVPVPLPQRDTRLPPIFEAFFRHCPSLGFECVGKYHPRVSPWHLRVLGIVFSTLPPPKREAPVASRVRAAFRDSGVSVSRVTAIFPRLPAQLFLPSFYRKVLRFRQKSLRSFPSLPLFAIFLSPRFAPPPFERAAARCRREFAPFIFFRFWETPSRRCFVFNHRNDVALPARP